MHVLIWIIEFRKESDRTLTPTHYLRVQNAQNMPPTCPWRKTLSKESVRLCSLAMLLQPRSSTGVEDPSAPHISPLPRSLSPSTLLDLFKPTAHKALKTFRSSCRPSAWRSAFLPNTKYQMLSPCRPVDFLLLSGLKTERSHPTAICLEFGRLDTPLLQSRL